MSTYSLTFDAVQEALPGPKWRSRWDRSWPAYEAWFKTRGGEAGPSLSTSEAALSEHMPELVPVHRELVRLAGGGDLAARFLSTWCPPPYLGGCSLAAHARGGAVRLVRNYDLSPDLNEGLLLKSAWTGRPVMGMIEFLWGLSDGINADGLAVALAYGGRQDVAPGFGITTILRYVLETCSNVDQAFEVLHRVPSHMAYNIALADRLGSTAMVEMAPGGGAERFVPAVATNHQHGVERSGRAALTKTYERCIHLTDLIAANVDPVALGDAFLRTPLYQRNYAEGVGTLFTAIYDPETGGLTLRWPNQDWVQSLDRFDEGRREISYDDLASAGPSQLPLPSPGVDAFLHAVRPFLSTDAAEKLERWHDKASGEPIEWADLGILLAPSSSGAPVFGPRC